MISRNNFSGYSNELILCLIWNESNFDPFRASGTGPRGLTMMSGIAVRELRRRGDNFNQDDVDVDPEANIGAGTTYLGHMRGRSKGKRQALQKYGTERNYPAQAIIDCEKCVVNQPPCGDAKRCLNRIHK